MPPVVLPARSDRAAAEALLPELIAAMGSDPLEIDASGAEQIGQAMLQLLLSARRSGAGATIHPSRELRDIARLTGLEAELFDEVRT